MTLPRGWTQAHIGCLCTLVNGRAFKPNEWSTSGLKIIRIQNLNRKEAEFNHFAGPVENKHLVEAGDLLFAWSGTPGTSFGAHIWRGQQAVLNQHIFKVSYKEEIFHREFLRLAINTKLGELIGKAHGGAGLAHVTKGRFEETKVEIPPKAEQRRIINKLDILNTRITQSRADLARISPLVRQLKQQALSTCFNVPPGHAQVMLGTILEGVQAGKNLRCEERPPRPGELGVVKVSAVTWGRFDSMKAKTLPPDYIPPETARIKAGDLLMSRANTLELVGAVALVEQAPRDLFLSDKVLRLIVPDDAKSWIHWFLRSPSGREQIERMATGNQLSMRNLSQNALRRIVLPFPDVSTRLGAVQDLEAAFAHADSLQFEAARAAKLLDQLEKSILAKVFRGELVLQDPADEPASVLLDRIRAERAGDPAGKRRGHSRTPALP